MAVAMSVLVIAMLVSNGHVRRAFPSESLVAFGSAATLLLLLYLTRRLT